MKKVRCRKTANSRRTFNFFKEGNDFGAQLEALFFIQAINLFHFFTSYKQSQYVCFKVDSNDLLREDKNTEFKLL